MNDETARQGRLVNSDAVDDTDSVRRFADRRRQVTALQAALLAFYSLLERARDELTREEFRALTWILCDRVGEEAARAVVVEALELTGEGAA
jgi:hypothetical protein